MIIKKSQKVNNLYRLIENISINKTNLNQIQSKEAFFNDEIYVENQEIFSTLEKWDENLLTPVFDNCFYYLKQNKEIIINIKQKYKEIIISSMKRAGFIYKNISYYNVRKSHYNKQQKQQCLLSFKKP